MAKDVYTEGWYCMTHATFCRTTAGKIAHSQSTASKCRWKITRRRSR